jgi:hypothetical protein
MGIQNLCMYITLFLYIVHTLHIFEIWVYPFLLYCTYTAYFQNIGICDWDIMKIFYTLYVYEIY